MPPFLLKWTNRIRVILLSFATQKGRKIHKVGKNTGARANTLHGIQLADSSTLVNPKYKQVYWCNGNRFSSGTAELIDIEQKHLNEARLAKVGGTRMKIPSRTLTE